MIKDNIAVDWSTGRRLLGEIAIGVDPAGEDEEALVSP